jgi:hypothetical protein
MKFIKVLFEEIKLWFDTQNEFKYKVVEQKKYCIYKNYNWVSEETQTGREREREYTREL